MTDALILRAGPASARLSRRGLLGLAGLTGALALTLLAGLMLGETTLPPSGVWGGLLGDGPAAFVVWEIRLPRVATGAMAGAAFGLAGALFQSLLRNPLASPDVIGFSAGATFGVVATVAWAAARGGAALPAPLGAAGGGLLAAALLLAFGWQRGGPAPLRLILVGIGLSFTFIAGTEALMIRLPEAQASEAARWLTGSLAGRGWPQAGQVALCGAVLVPVLVALSGGLRLLELGDEAAAGLGLRVARARASLAALAVGFSAAGVAVAGPVPFVALLAAPLARRLAGQEGAALCGAALVGAMMVPLADLAARTLVTGVQLPAGVLTGVAGAPVLLWLLRREMDRGTL